jgi:putative ABC transport system permease protein
MLRNYLKIAVRTLSKNRAYAIINVSGLALSMTCGILIFMLVRHHLSFDNFHNDSDRIYRFVTEQHRDQIDYTFAVPNPLGKVFREEHTFGEKVARIATFDEQLITVSEGPNLVKFKEDEGVSFAEPEFFDIFNYPLIEGNIKTALSEPNTVILTESKAKKLFKGQNAMNKSFKLENKVTLKVTGILKDLPENTDRKAEIFASFVTLKTYEPWFFSDSWGGISSPMQCFVKLRPGISVAQVEGVLPAYVKKYRPDSKNVHHYKLQPLADIHFNPHYGGAMDKKNLWVLSFIGLFLIVTACVNFINLATAQALRRSKEVGVRKVLGSVRAQLFWQFISETGIIAVLGVAGALVLAALALPYVNEWFDSGMSFYASGGWQLIGFIAAMSLFVTFFAGSYPGLILAGFQPVMALKGRLSQQNIGGFNTRRTLIITQFAISQILIIGMIVIAKQMKYAKQSDLGFNKDAVVMVPAGSDSTLTKIKTLKSQLETIPGVEKISLCGTSPSSQSNWNNSIVFDNRPEPELFRASMKFGDDQYLSTFGLKLAAGRNVFPSDTVREFLVNETFIKKLNFTSPEDVLGKTIAANGGEMVGKIVGVVKDFHDLSFHADINAVCISTELGREDNFAIKVDPRNIKSTLGDIEQMWSAKYPDEIYEHVFMDDYIAEFYQTEDTMLKLIQVFSFIAIFIGCLGLYGLVSFMVAQKTKEIGIRKVLGGTVSHILWIFGKEFVRLVLIAFVVAGPLAWWLMSAWLKDFQFQIPLSPWFFILTIAGTLVVAMLTVGYQALKASLMDPVKSLKSE